MGCSRQENPKGKRVKSKEMGNGRDSRVRF